MRRPDRSSCRLRPADRRDLGGENFPNGKIICREKYHGLGILNDMEANTMIYDGASLGFETIPKDTTNKGITDLTLKVDNKAYIFEFKYVNKISLDKNT
jgi:hypothetical protein